jgi:hypothetical protein
MRAQSGGIQLSALGGGGIPASPTCDTADPVTRLQQAKQMLDRQLNTDAEYEAIKARVIGTV